MRDEAAQLAAIGTSPAERKQLAKVAATGETTVARFAERFYREIQARDRKDNTIPRRYLDKDILLFIGQRPIGEITTEDVRALIWRKKDHGFDAAAGQIRGLLKRMMDYAVTSGAIPVNPVLALPMPHVRKARARKRALSPQEIGEFLKGPTSRTSAVSSRLGCTSFSWRRCASPRYAPLSQRSDLTTNKV